MFYIIFKSSAGGRAHIFRMNEPFAQFVVVPAEYDFELVPINEEDAEEGELQARRIY